MKEAESEVSSQSYQVKRRSGNFIDRTGQVYGRLTVLRQAPAGKWSNARWECKCTCGQSRIIPSSNLQSGTSTSCGCLARELTAQRSTTHGGASAKRKHPLYKIWDGIKQRCHNPDNPAYDRYGGRGIAVCDCWRNDFMAFVADMGERPSSSHSIERKDNNLGYSKENCIWATKTEQANNRRNTICLTHDGRTQTLARWAREIGIQGQTIMYRIHTGWSIERALTTKIEKRQSLSTLPQISIVT